MKILVTGAAGFIGYHVCRVLLDRGHEIVGLDNINNYYDISLKFARLGELGINKSKASKFHQKVSSSSVPGFQFVRMHLENSEELEKLFKAEKFEVVCHLAAQAGVRYSLENPRTYINSNIIGFINILENCRNFGIKHLVYASSSSVYGANKKVPFEVTDNVDHPISLYAATKKSNELMAYTYSHLFGFPTTGLRFFTVYGPWGRPDMAYFLFTEAILKGEPIKVFNQGNLARDFTYIDDVVQGVLRVVESPVEIRKEKGEEYKIYNIGNNRAEKLMDFIEAIEEKLGKKSEKLMLPMQPGDVEKTWANVDPLIRDYDYKPVTQIEEGVASFIDWYKRFYEIN